MFLELNFPWSYILGQYILYAFYCFSKQCWITSSNWQGCNHSLFTDDNSSCKYKSLFHFSNSSLVLPGYSTGNYFSLTFISSLMMWVQAWIGRCFAWKHGFYPWALNVNVIIYLTWAIFICKVFWGSLRWHIELARAGRWREDILGTSEVTPNGRGVTIVCFESRSFWVFFWLSCHALQLLAVCRELPLKIPADAPSFVESHNEHLIGEATWRSASSSLMSLRAQLCTESSHYHYSYPEV